MDAIEKESCSFRDASKKRQQANVFAIQEGAPQGEDMAHKEPRLNFENNTGTAPFAFNLIDELRNIG